MKLNRKNLLFAAASALASFVCTATPAGAGQIWDGTGPDDNWDTPANWDSDTSPDFASAIDFAGPTRLAPVNNLAADTTIGGINFTNTTGDAFSLTGARITLGGDITTTANTAGLTILDSIGLDMILSANRIITTNQQSATVQHNLTIGGVISDAGGARSLTKAGAGVLTLTVNSTYTGTTTISAGTLSMPTPNRIGTSSGIIIGNGASLTVTGGAAGFILTSGQTITGTGATGTVVTGTNGLNTSTAGANTISSSGTLTISRFNVAGTGHQITGGAIRSGRTTASFRGILIGSGNTGNLTITGGSLTTFGNATATNQDLIGSGTNGAGELIINGGSYAQSNSTNRLILGNGASGGSGTLTLTNGSATVSDLVYNAGSTQDSIVNLDALGTLTVSKITSTAGLSRIFNFNGGQFIAGGTAFTGASGLTLNVKDGGAKINTNANSVTIADALVNFGGSSTGGLTKSGAGTLTLSAANNYTGASQIDGGILAFGTKASKTAATATAAAAGSVGLGVKLSDAAYYSAADVGDLFNTNTLTGFSLDAASGVAIDTTNAGGSFDQTVALTAARALTKLGTGTLVLSQINTYTGNTTVSQGTLTLSSAPDPLNANTGNDASTVTIAVTGATLDLAYTGTDIVDKLFYGAAQQPAGTYSASSVPAGASITPASFSGSGTLTVANPSNFASWAASQVPPVIGGPTGDSDNDGVKNLVEYALADGQERGTLTGTTLSFTKRGAPWGTDITYDIETSTTLEAGSWTTLGKPPVSETSGSISYTLTPSTPVKNFARLKVTGL